MLGLPVTRGSRHIVSFAVLGLSLLVASSALALSPLYERCDYQGEVCVDGPSTKVINGVSVYRACWQYQATYRCLPNTAFDQCVGLAAAYPNCWEASASTCVNTDPVSGTCIEWRHTYACLGTRSDADIVPVGTSYTVVGDTRDTSQCTTYANNPNCQIHSEVCTEGPETRVINNLPVYRDCWAWEYDYICLTGTTTDDCGTIDQQCTLSSQSCLSENEAGDCMTLQKVYACQGDAQPGGPTSGQVTCGESVYCIGGDCKSFTRTANQDFSHATTQLATLNAMAKSLDEGTLTVFGGTADFCDKSILGFANCCKETGWGLDISLASCSEGEKLLAEKQAAGLCIYVGTFCSSKFLGICMELKNSYCCFTSKLGRIINVQGRSQLGLGWGDPKSPACQGLTVSQIQALDFSQLDLSELYQDIQVNVRSPEESTNSITQRLQDFYEQ